ncbi:MAG: CarD-like/TRCF domain protein [Lachnospiraceae bacterium]|nr:CarD-like/TRCF domain protein [Lachnospiraceae bacterium]
MFQKKDIIYSETIGVCIVDDIVKLADNQKDTYNYYLLRSVFDKSKKAYIPVENHSVRLRELITQEEAQVLKDSDNFAQLSQPQKNEVSYVLVKKWHFLFIFSEIKQILS